MDSLDIKNTALKYALQNAVSFNGEAQFIAVIGKVIGVFQKKGVNPKDIIPIVKKIVSEVNQLSLEDQKNILIDLAPELLEKKKKIRDFSLPDLPDAKKGKVITRFPPEPNGYLHIGHAKAAIVDYEYAKKYDGKFILRFDDTNPEKDFIEFYDAQKKDLEWLGIKWNKVYNTSDNLDKHYDLALQLIKQHDAYVCTCSPDEIKTGRYNKKSCSCSTNDESKNLDLWEKMLSSDLTNSILRLKADMKSVNTAMRDPTLFRTINAIHPLQKDKYHIWPTYDFAGAVEDSISGVTHPFRTKEYELRDECYYYLLERLNLRKPHLMEFARLSIQGMPVSKRKIKPLIEKKLVSGYDDVRLPTLQGLKKRGIIPEAIKKFVLSQGISKVESSVSFSLLEAENRKIIDPLVKRLFFVSNPVKLIVENSLDKTISISYHPTDDKLGKRKISTNNSFFISSSDADLIKVGEVFRLKDLYNVKITDKNDGLKGIYSGNELISDSLKIQWTTNNNIPVKVFIPKVIFIDDEFNADSLKQVNGYCEESINDIKDGEIVQFERFGFVRVEHQTEGIICYFTHR
jgi:glutamyl-tRNA synthetase